MFHTKLGAGRDRLKPVTAIVAAVVGQHTREAHPPARKPVDGPGEKARRRGPGLIRQDFDVGRPTVVIDGDVRVFPADAPNASAAIAMDPMPDARDAGERFDIEMHQVARSRPFVAHDRRRRVSRARRLSPARARIAATVERGTCSCTAIAHAVRRS